MQSVWAALAILICTITLSARAEDKPLGLIETLSGTATVIHGDMVSAARLGMPVYENHLLQTRVGGELGVTFHDDTGIVLGPNGRIQLAHFIFQPAAQEYGFILRLAQGTLEYISGLTEKLAPDAMSIETP